MPFWVVLLFALSYGLAQTIPSGDFRLVASRYLGSQIIFSAAYSPVTPLVAAATLNHLHLYDPLTFQEVRRISTGRWNLAVAFSPDGRYLASGGGPSPEGAAPEVSLWDPSTGLNLATMAGHTDSIESLAFSPDGQILASVSRDGSVIIWEVPSGRSRAVLRHSNDGLTALSFTSDGRLATGTSRGQIILWEAGSAQSITSWSAHTQGIRSLTFSADDRWLASASQDGGIRVWAANTYQLAG